MARGSGLRLSSDNEHHRNPAAATILRTSRLSKDQPNRILIYPGSFNPPHISHLQVLRHALESSPDLNIVAAIISMMDEDHLERKNQLSGRSLVLTSKKRAKLWYEDSRFPACAWVCESWTIFDNLREDLIREATKDDLEIRFMSLRGPDSWNVFDPPMPNSTYKEYLISDAGREAEWYVVKGPPQVATWYTPWERVNPSTIRTNGQAEQGGKSRSKLGTRYAMEMLKATPCFTESAIAESSPIESLASLTSSELSNRSSIPCDSGSEASISSASDLDNDADNEDSIALKIHEDVFWECHLEYNPKVKVRFVSKRHHPQTKSRSDDCKISSTAISRIIANNSGETLREKLKDLVLSPDLLFEYLETTEVKIRE